jgi:hypothetical protein
MTIDGVTLLRYGFLSGQPTAAVEGTIRIRDGCVWIESESLPDAPTLLRPVLWPSSSRLEHGESGVQVVIQGVRLDDGQEATLGGGAYSDRAFVVTLVGSLPSECLADDYWLATEVNLGHTIPD